MSMEGQPQQRIRIGLTGLAFVFLLVLLGTAISRSGEDSAAPPTEPVNLQVEPNEPLAEIGAAPGQSQPTANSSEAPDPSKP